MTHSPDAGPRRPLPAAPKAPASWPAGVPSLEEALRLLRGTQAPPADVAPVLARLVPTLSDLEVQALKGGPLPFDAAPLRDALGMRLRLTLALERVPKAASEADRAALNALLAQVDQVLEGLRAYQELPQPEVLKRIEATRNALVRDAVALSEVVSPATPEPARPAAPKKAGAATGKVVLLSAQDAAAQNRQQRRNLVAIAAAVVVALGGAAYHVWSGRTSFTPPPTVPGAPAGIGVTQDASGRMVVRTNDGKEPSEPVRAWLSLQESKGFRRRTLGTGLFILEPSGESPPAAAP